MKITLSAVRLAILLWALLYGTQAAQAGHWVLKSYESRGATFNSSVGAIFPPPSYPGATGLYQTGTVPFDLPHQSEEVYSSSPTAYRHNGTQTGVGWSAGQWSMITGTKVAPGSVAALKLNVYPIYKWIANSDYDPTTDDAIADPPSDFIYTLEYSRVTGAEQRYHAIGHHFVYSHFSNGLGDAFTEGADLDGSHNAQAVGMLIQPLPSEGKAVVEGPVRVLTAHVKMNPTYTQEEPDSWGDAAVKLHYEAAPLQFTPDPAGLPVMDCAPNSKTLNQYVMNGSGGLPFLIACQVSAQPFPTQEIDEQLRQGFSWQIERAPLPMLAAAPYGSSRSTFDITVKRRSYPPDPNSPVQGATPTPGPTPTPTAVPPPNATPMPTATPIDGMGFDTRGGLPASTYAFGPNTIFHQFADSATTTPKIIASSDIALFYEAAATTHPYGGPKGYYFGNPGAWIEIDTPNWFYYYNQAYSPPCPVQYWYQSNPALYGQYRHGDPFIRLCNAYGTWPTVLFRKINGKLTVVGREIVRGIDTYARVLAHENAHKRCYEAIHNGGFGDSDLDGVPDAWETNLGMKVEKDTDSTGFIAFYGNYEPKEADSEAFARLYEEGVVGPLEGDWAADTTFAAKFGLNWAAPPAPNRCLRTALQDINRQPTTSVPGDIVTNKP